MGQITIFSGVERRRQWSADQKRALVEAAFAPGAVVAEVARTADLRSSQIYRWRRDLFGDVTTGGSGFSAVMVSRDRCDAPVPVPAAITIEIAGSVVRVAADTPAKLVTMVLRSLAR